MELVANVWPVFDENTRLVLRYFMRAYLINATDAVISATLRALAPTDFRLARVFSIPPRFQAVSEHGALSGCVTLADFRDHQADILGPAFEDLEKDYAVLQGMSITNSDAEPIGVALMPRFAPQPYLVVTALLETPDGRLIPQLPS